MRGVIVFLIDTIIESVKEVLETTPPEIVSDVMHRGVHVVGGGALLRGIGALLNEAVRIPIYIADDPLTAVARGAGIILEDIESYRDILIQNEDDLPHQK